MSGEISREELVAFTEVTRQTATSLEKISGELGAIVSNTNKIYEKLTNGMSTEITKAIIGGGDEKTTLNVVGKDTKQILEDIKFTKYLIGFVSLAIIIVTSVTTLVIRNVQERSGLEKAISVIRQDLSTHENIKE